ncbi:alpha/beta hydrolase [Aridibaculum aurantiacum]|uniref:alpha/beta hydrolase n=1 Tax=Aridibaculum aurantiacum TaxID=2810307 RepID=UPI001A959261|nr:alpha/beta hydrolase [Aridibaculum aurantiacum]
MKILNLLSILLLVCTSIVSCDKKENSLLAESNMKNIKYGANAAQAMDIYLPAGRTTNNTKVLVFIHGGSWSGGDKSDFDGDINAIRGQLQDYAIFNINYRLAIGGANRFPAQIEDIQMALEFIANNAAEYRINPSKIGLVGASAGAHLGLLYAYKHNSNGNIKAVVNLFGPTNLTSLYTSHPVPAASQPVLQNFLGTTPLANPTLYANASPVNYVTAQSPATLILHGTMDYIVPISQSTELRAALTSAGAKVEMHTYNGEGHGWYGTTLQDTYSRTISFVKANVQ